MEADYVIVGAGAAGCALARRLSDDPRRTVLLLEQGGPDRHPLLHVPKGFFYTLRGGRYARHYRATGPGGRSEDWTRGTVLGGSTAVNGMMWLRGARPDFDALEAAGNPGWGWDRVLAGYRALEDHASGASDSRGAGGPYGVSIPAAADRLTADVLAAGRARGWAVVEDVNDGDAERIGRTPQSIRDGVRTSAYRAFVHPVRDRPNLTVLTGVRAATLRFAGRRVVGVDAVRRGAPLAVAARREVIVSAGTVETPLLLERSGIGRPEVLRAAGLWPRVESPHVGERVVEQRAVSLQVRLHGRAGSTMRLYSAPKQALQALLYLATRSGPLATGGYDVTFQARSAPDVRRPDVQGIVAPFALAPGTDLRLADHAGLLVVGYALRPTTTGSVHVTGPALDDPPIIEARFLEHAAERATTGRILAIARDLLAEEPLASRVAGEDHPGPAVATPEQVVELALATGTGIFHAVGSAAMGPAADDVVDPCLRVRGVDGLRVADASVLPFQVSGNSAAPATVVGWFAADLVLADA